jgi:hypothetical protein
MLKTICAAGLLACGLAYAADTAPVPTCTLVPGWTQKGEARSYVGDNLFEYMDGNAEGYLIYGFQSMHGVNCVKGPVTLVIDISDFGENDLSYGMFTANRDLRQPEAQSHFHQGPVLRRNRGRPGRRPYTHAEGVDGGVREAGARQHFSARRSLLVPG